MEKCSYSEARNKWMHNPMKIPLFPLGTVLFPGGVLPLRIFEPRYLTMIGNCMREGIGFGVVLITEGRESGEAAQFHPVGTLARIEDFDQLEDGHLGVTCRGDHRFRVLSSQVQEDQLITAAIEPLQENEIPSLPDEYQKMQAFLRELYQREDLKTWAETIQPDWNNGHWLACRLIEVLPLANQGRQALLEMESGDRLANLARVMNDNEML